MTKHSKSSDSKVASRIGTNLDQRSKQARACAASPLFSILFILHSRLIASDNSILHSHLALCCWWMKFYKAVAPR